MSKHLSYRTSNPALNSNTFKNTTNNNSLFLDKTMTIKGTVDKTALSLVLLILAGYYSYSPDMTSMILVGSIGGLIVAILTIFKKEWAPITVPIYAILEGVGFGFSLIFVQHPIRRNNYSGYLFNSFNFIFNVICLPNKDY